jgi:integrase
MPRTVKDELIGSPSAREKLKPRRKPYYRAIDRELHLGYRRNRIGGVWVLRWYRGDGKYVTEGIGTADGNINADGAIVLNFSQAQAKARDLFVKRKREAAGLPTKDGPYTVRRCVEEYVQWLSEHKKTATDARYRIDALIIPALGNVPCNDLTKTSLEKWIRDLVNTPARVRSKKGEVKTRPLSDDPEAIRKRKVSAKRTSTILFAALNRAWREGKIETDLAWRRVERFKGVDAARIRYLTIDESRRLINACEPDFRLLVRAALATGARYSELAALRVSDFNPDSATVHIRTSKSGKGRHVVLADEGRELFSTLVAGRPSEALLLVKAGGGQWGNVHQQKPIAEACRAARIDPAISFHILRHTYASHAVMNGAPLIVVAKNLGHRDTRMVEEHYGHLADTFVSKAIRDAAPKFGPVDTNVAPIGAGR